MQQKLTRGRGRIVTRKRVAWLGALAVSLVAARSIHADDKCDKCSGLCQLMDWYLQREWGAEWWSHYASSSAHRSAPPKGVTDTAGIENAFKQDFDDWLRDRNKNGMLPCWMDDSPPPPPGLPPPAGQPQESNESVANLSTVTQNDSCEIQYDNKKLEGPNRKAYEDKVKCKPLSDAEISHETVHQEFCMRQYAQDHAGAAKFLDQPENVAQSELEAWSHERDVLQDAIHDLVQKEGCGWIPTHRQQHMSNAIPSIEQMKQMERQGWEIVNEAEQTL